MISPLSSGDDRKLIVKHDGNNFQWSLGIHIPRPVAKM